MLFLPFAIIIYLLMLLVGIVDIIAGRQTELALVAKTAELRALLAEKEFHSTMENMQQIRKMRHDIDHHFAVIAGYLADNKTKEALGYIESASDLMPKRSLTGKNIVTISFVEQYRTLCEQNHISFADLIAYDEDLITDKTALGIILGNGLKNAFESATTANDKLRFIRISGKQVHDNIAITIENGFDHEINSDFKSTKAKNRGLGISNINDSVEKCGGYMECSYKNNVFTLEAVLVTH